MAGYLLEYTISRKPLRALLIRGPSLGVITPTIIRGNQVVKRELRPFSRQHITPDT